MRTALRLTSALASLMLAAACGSNGGPASPAGPSPTAAAPAPASAATPGATISGSLSSGSASGVAQPSDASARVSPVQMVLVVGTSLSATVDGAGRFTFADVPAGTVQLRFTGPGTDATLPVGSVRSGETLSLVVAVQGPLAMIITDSRNPNVGQIPVNGVIDSLTGSAAAFEFRIGSRTIRGDTLTVFFGDGDRPDTFASLSDGSRVEVKALQRDGYLYAFRIHVNAAETSPAPAPPSPTPAPAPPQDSSASIEGPLTSIGGAAPGLQLVVAGTTVRTSGQTSVQRRGDKQDLSTLRLGMTLHVVGDRQPDGSIDARFIQIKDDDTGGAFEIEGSLGGLKGTCPSVTFGVNGFAIGTGPATVFSPACNQLKSGNKVRVRGTRLANGDVQATEVTRQ